MGILLPPQNSTDRLINKYPIHWILAVIVLQGSSTLKAILSTDIWGDNSLLVCIPDLRGMHLEHHANEVIVERLAAHLQGRCCKPGQHLQMGKYWCHIQLLSVCPHPARSARLQHTCPAQQHQQYHAEVLSQQPNSHAYK